jgi:hypothetical protein
MSVFGILFVMALAPTSVAPQDDTAVLDKLRSVERTTRVKALQELRTQAKIPADVLAELPSLARRELIESLYSASLKPGGKAVDAVPLTGEETSLVRVKANPGDYVGRTFIVCGAVNVIDYYNYGYDNAKETHYSLGFREMGAGATFGESATVYLPRSLGGGLVEGIVKTEETGLRGGRLLRMRVTIDADRYKEREQSDMFELLDWQFVSEDRKSWKPWTFEGVRSCFELLERAGSRAVPFLIEVLIAPPEDEFRWVDDLIRSLAVESIGRMDTKSRESALQKLRFQLNKTKAPSAKKWLQEAIRKVSKK